MKRIKWFALFATAIVLCFGTISCGGDDPSPSTPSSSSGGGSNDDDGGGDDGDNPPGDKILTKSEQTELLESTARELIAMAPASDFEEVTSLKQDVRQQNWNNVNTWFNDIFKQTFETVSDNLDNTYTYDYGNGKYTYNYYSRNFKAAFLVSNYKGHFELQSGVWKLVDSNVSDLQFTFKDSHNDIWTMRAVTIGPLKKVHMFALKERNYDYSYEQGASIYKYYTDITQYIIGVPKTFEVMLTKNGNQVVKTTINAELSDITGEEFDLSKDDLSASATVEVKNYKIDISQVVYKHNKSANVSTTVTKGDKQMFSLSVSSELSGVPAVNISAFTNNFDKKSLEYTEGNAIVKVDILGKVQIQGTAKKIHGLVDILEEADNNKENESIYKSKIQEANEHIDLGLFYNNKTVKQADVYLEPFSHTAYRYSYNSNTSSVTPISYNYWGWDLVIKFGDESSYSTLSNYFSKSNFRSVYGDLQTLLDSYKRLTQ